MDQLVNPTSVSCPRCGYDQRGVVATWVDRCPMEGICAECGLSIVWSKALQPEKYEPPWCVEFARPRSIILACVGTSLRSFRPWVFWSRLRMSQRIRWLRLLVYCYWLLLPLLVTYAIAQSTVAVIVRNEVEQSVMDQWNQDKQELASTQQSMQSVQSSKQFERFTDAQVAAIISQLNVQIAALQLRTSAPPVIDQSYLEAIFEAVVKPIGNSSRGSINWADGTAQQYPSPSTLYAQARGSWSSFDWTDEFIRGAMAILCTLLFTLLLPASFVLLPASRKRAKVRWSHLTRILIYSLVFVSASVVVQIVGTAWSMAKPVSTAASMMHYSHFIVWIGLPIWWLAAIRRYLLMPHAGAIAALLSLMIALLLSPCLLAIMPSWLVRLVLG